jgi:hypothetical protein
VLASAVTSAVLSLSVLAAPAPAVQQPSATDDRGTAAAKQALAEVTGLLDGVTPMLPTTEPSSELTLALRDLALLRSELPATQQEQAEALLARPTDGGQDQFDDGYTTAEAEPVCSAVVCVHYVTTTTDRVPSADRNENGVPDYVDLALRTMTDVHDTYVDAQFRPPKSDLAADNNGGDERPDVYLANVGVEGFYGYCATDENLPADRPQDTWGYCVLDNDYSTQEFPTNTPRENLEVTAAHEYFHAVQFGYDVSEDAWIMEATATWAEDELYDAVNDNLQYLRRGPMARPEMSLDQFTGNDVFHYGTWIFFRYLTERFPYSQGGMPILVRDLWRRLDDAPGGRHEYSLRGLKSVLHQRGLSLTEAFAGFSAANRMPERSYDEGGRYPSAPLAASTTLWPGRLTVGRQAVSLDHLAAATLRYRPGARLRAADWKLRVGLDLAARWKGTGAVVTIKPRSGAPRTRTLTLDKDGDRSTRFGFSARSVKFIEITLVNASDDFHCGRRTRFSCAGQPKFDNQVQRITARAFRP